MLVFVTVGVVSSGGPVDGVGAISAADVFSDVVSDILSPCAVPESQLVCN